METDLAVVDIELVGIFVLNQLQANLFDVLQSNSKQSLQASINHSSITDLHFTVLTRKHFQAFLKKIYLDLYSLDSCQYIKVLKCFSRGLSNRTSLI